MSIFVVSQVSTWVQDNVTCALIDPSRAIQDSEQRRSKEADKEL